MRSLARVVWLAVLLAAIAVQAQDYEGRTLVRASLVADTSAVVPGQKFQVGLLLEQAPGWHTYWQYAGDAGAPTTIEWTLPEGFGAGPIDWPLPERDLEPGDILVYAYSDRVLLLTTIVAPEKIATEVVTLRGSVRWLVCGDICIPGTAEVELTLPVAPTASPANQALFEEFRNRLPQTTPPPFQLAWSRADKEITLALSGLDRIQSVDFFPLPAENQIVGHPVPGPVSDGRATIQIPAQGDLRGVLITESPEGRNGWIVASADAPPPNASTKVANASPGGGGLWMALVYGFLGGLILNVMPCVLPVISLKIFGFVRQAGDHPARILRHGLAFAAGIFAFFLGLAAVVIGLKLAGTEVTWAFQFQNPWFNVVLSSIVLIFALNLFGVFEIVLPGRATTVLAEASGGEGYAGSFFQGVFATLLATPCTAPFLGAALGFAFAQPPAIILAVFGAVAFGMAVPYVLLSAQPGWMKILPKPGVWMERVKQFMGFPLLATVLWMLYIVGNQKGLEGVVWLASFLLCLSIACWVYGAFCGPLSGGAARVAALVVAAALAVGGGWVFLGVLFPAAHRDASAPAAAGDGIAWVPFSQGRLADLLGEGRTVFLDFTADWCLTCKLNERTAIDRPAVRDRIKELGIVPMRADWTNADPEITAALKKFQRVGVPFYVIYPRGDAEKPIVLPELLTEQIVLDALARAAGAQ